MEIEIKEVSQNIVMLFEKTAGKLIQLKRDSSTKYLGAYVDGKIVGFCGYMETAGHIRMKADYVVPSMRGKGIYSRLCEERERICLEIAAEKGYKKFSAFSSKMSRETFKRFGFVEVKQVRERTAYMEKEIKNGK